MKKGYTKYDYINIYSKLGGMTGTFAAVSISLALFLGFVITLASHAHPDLSSRICLLLFVLNLPVVLRSVKHYRAIQNKLQRKQPDDAEGNVTSQIILPTRKQFLDFVYLFRFLISSGIGRNSYIHPVTAVIFMLSAST